MDFRITADWIFSEFTNTISSSFEGIYGDILFSYVSIEDRRWIELVFDSYGINYVLAEDNNGELGENFRCWFYYSFKFIDILKNKDDFPRLINQLKDLNDHTKEVYRNWERLVMDNQVS